jgi:hypothetical protein
MGLLIDLTRGAIGGALGTYVMDLVTTALMERQPASVTAQEADARPNGKSSVENLVDLLEDASAQKIPKAQRPTVERAVHFGLGVVPGALYAVTRRAPLGGSTRGIAFGLLLWALNDEFLNTRLGLAGPYDAYPPETHLRGLIGHVALGITTDMTIFVLGG